MRQQYCYADKTTRVRFGFERKTKGTGARVPNMRSIITLPTTVAMITKVVSVGDSDDSFSDVRKIDFLNRY
jgi:hypothetical protein